MITIEVDRLAKRFGTFEALRGVSLSVEPGSFLALLGPSGSGKTTLLRMIAGLDFPDSGMVRFSGEDMSRRAARERRVGFVFQHYALFRHMTVADNVAFGLSVRPAKVRPAPDEIARRVQELLALVQLEGMARRYPHQLSGGQRQRVALARALAIEPSVLLLDEPFGALDARVRKELRGWLRRLHEQMGLTTIFVTHDQEEALELADRVVVMNQGRIEQIGPPQEVYDRPASPFVFDFLGEVNRIACEVRAGAALIGPARVALDETLPDGRATAFVRPHDVILAEAGDTMLTAEVLDLFAAGPNAHVTLKLDDPDLVVEAQTTRLLAQTLDLAPGARVGVLIGRLRVFIEPETEPSCPQAPAPPA